jgi:putative hydrolase of the HAD superfamily
MPIHAIVFDVDGVLVNPPYRFAKHLEQAHGLTMQHTREFFAGRFLKCLVGQADLKIEIGPFLQRWGIEMPIEKFLARWFEVEHEVDGDLLGVVQSLRQHGLRCYVGTNQERYRTAYLRNEMRFAEHFDGVFASTELGAAKPDAAFYLKVTQALNLPPDEILFWDDSEQNVAAARAVGWQAEHYISREKFVERMANLGMRHSPSPRRPHA